VPAPAGIPVGVAVLVGFGVVGCVVVIAVGGKPVVLR
jgi:hypothetical protein